MIREITLNNRLIQYDLIYKNVKNINLRIQSDQSVFVSANESVSMEIIDSFLQTKADYILMAVDKYAESAKYSPKPKAFVSGESFRILGRDLRLTLLQGSKNSVETDESYIYLSVTNMIDFDLKKKIIDKWIIAKCQKVIREMCETVYPKFKKYGVDFPEIKFRDMISRWGSCQPKRKTLTFNNRLIEVPLSCIEYVIVHEFTHFLQPNHSKKFYYHSSCFPGEKCIIEMTSWIICR